MLQTLRSGMCEPARHVGTRLRQHMRSWFEAHGVYGKTWRECFRPGWQMVIDVAVFGVAVLLAIEYYGIMALRLLGR